MPANSKSRPAGDLGGLDVHEDEEFARHRRGLFDAAHPPQVAEPRGHAARNRRQQGIALGNPPAERRRPQGS